MKYKVFEDLPVWQAAIEFSLKVFEFTDAADFRVRDTKINLRGRPFLFQTTSPKASNVGPQMN